MVVLLTSLFNCACLDLIKVQESFDTLHRDDQIDNLREKERHLDQWSLHQAKNNQRCSCNVEGKVVACANVCCESHSRQQIWKQVDASDHNCPSKVDLPQSFEFFGASAEDPLHEALLPRVQLEHLDIVDGLCRHLHTPIFAAHDDLLLLVLVDANGKVEEDSDNKHAQSGKEVVSEEVERKGERQAESYRHLHDLT